MSKIICEICGTSYPETEEKCPICGCSKDFGLESFDDILDEETGYTETEGRRKNRGIFDYDEVNAEEEPETPEEDAFDDEELYEEEPRSNTALVVILVILIVLLLLAAGFFFVRFFLPNMMEEEETFPIVTTEAVEETTEETTEETQDPAIVPCTDLSIPGGKVELAKDGKWLLNVQVYPEDTTDTLTFTSADESIATVSEDGTVTAVGEGKTTIIVVCGSRQINCNVTVDYSLESEAPEDGTIPAMTVDPTEEPQETTAEGETQAAEETQPSEAPQETTEETVDPNAVLKLKKSDITIFSNRVSVTLELENDIPMDQIKWFTMDSTVAIVHDGVVTATGSGITRIYGEYQGQQVECIVRCSF